MRSVAIAIAGAVMLGAGWAAHAQTATNARGFNLPHERQFWGHVGASFGQSRLDITCPGGGCDDSEPALRIFGGGRFNNTFGGEIGFVNMGTFQRGGGDTEMHALDFAGTAGFPFGQDGRHSVFAKAGLVYGRTDVTGTAAGLQTGKANGWGPRFGLGLQLGFTENWALRLDYDRYRIKMPDGRENVDTFMAGVQYQFR